MFLTAPDLQKHSAISHGFFGRKGGVSGGIYSSLNCGRGSSDNPAHVAENRRRVLHALGNDRAPLYGLYQIHSNDVVVIDRNSNADDLPRADAMVTREKGLALGVLAADCVPVLFADPEAQIIGAAHSGWKGALGGILENTIAAMQHLGADKKRIIAAIGPSIAQKSYEVGAEYRAHFMNKNKAFAEYFIPSKLANHFYFDIKRFARDRLKDAGVSTINLLENDTYLEEDAFFSFRRTTHRSERDYGRQISVIMLNEK